MKIQPAENYSVFSLVYDQVMDHIDYHIWGHFILESYLSEKSSYPSIILDIACGSGELLKKMSAYHKASYHGLDICAEFVELATLKTLGRIPIEQGDMMNLPYENSMFELVTATHDSINYLLQKKDLQLHLSEVSRVLQKHGIYFLDVTSEENIRKYFHNKTKKVKKNGIQLKWSNIYNFQTRIIKSTLEFIKDGQLHVETHFQKYYSPEEIQKIARLCNLELCHVYYDYNKKDKRKKASLIILIFKKVAPG